ncbi:PEP-CTERM sorting domain-containing protein [Azohydromonas aeria]|uniref:PEP-CTERM sorting domain-containing protein n=1 Tax=Azohydromonas aeria TaxID=2590212 RepID=UPI0012F9569A|nr:PEP-CTERM sorting domain-containing protein [Azohydromonas aeria]
MDIMALGAVAAASANMARADATFDVRLKDFGYRLIDLRPDDGIAPALALGPNFYNLRADVGSDSCMPPYCSAQGSYVHKGGQFDDGGSLFREVDFPYAEAAFGISGALASHSLEIHAQGVARNTRASRVLSSRATLTGTPAYRVAFTVTPFTEVVWSGTLLVDLAQTLGRRGARVEVADAEGRMLLTDEAGETVEQAFFGHYLTPGQVDRRSGMQDFGLGFANAGAQSRQFTLETRFDLQGESLFPVPEPGTNWLMLGGLGLLAGVAGARRRGSA